MALEALSTSELLNYIIYDTLSATPFSCNDFSDNNTSLNPPPLVAQTTTPLENSSSEPPQMVMRGNKNEGQIVGQKKKNLAVSGGARKKRRRRPKVCKNKEEAETQRMTHIAVERNRRKQMNEHLAVLRSLMPESYAQRGDQASIVGGAIEYVKELEHVLQSLEAQKLRVVQQGTIGQSNDMTTMASTTPFGQFFSYPQYTCSQFSSNKFTSKSKAAIADIEVTLIETHANVRVLSRRRVRQLSKMVAAFHTLFLTILHLNVTSLEPLVLYSISAKVEEGCQFSSSDEIAGAVHHVLRIIEEEASLLSC
ncbi:hypothetical protein Leryth_010539 [Lithospermum erythrorhizon]|uniref:Basic helix-loop-helix transcription factor n=1 Tax=Lithospermum erythrorhizon TaxID=34254 RepID=A0AAV3NIS5_LITER|nr:hypothetical protein Leryth_010539 [Lithospermum erythrorhizon]